MTKEEKHLKAVMQIRLREDYHFERAKFCRDHNMSLETIFHQQMEQELRRLASKIEDILDTGYISLEKYKTNE